MIRRMIPSSPFIYLLMVISDVFEFQVVFTPQAVFSHLWIVNVHVHICDCLSGFVPFTAQPRVVGELTVAPCSKFHTSLMCGVDQWLLYCCWGRFCSSRLKFHAKFNWIQFSWILSLTSEMKISFVFFCGDRRNPSSGTNTQHYFLSQYINLL